MIRGAILNITAELEGIIDRAIVNYYCIDVVKKDEMTYTLLTSDRISLENKRQVLEIIVMNSRPNLYKKKLKETLRDIAERIIPRRNEFAHGIMHDDYIKDENPAVGFIRYKNGKKKINMYTYSQVIDLIKLAEKCVEDLGELFISETDLPPQ